MPCGLGEVANKSPLSNNQPTAAPTEGRCQLLCRPGQHVKPAWEVAPTATANTSRKEAHQNRWAG
ncbi:hypothetical protein PGTUg99_021516 [Puccinia graminis f. sp. tritici]|uniref:Uncharacterized protein n=1 Tax=Puccinia graminis f. sp. tritici TaxID=56615 RepID=A0A5B0PMC6_PUCGR|nr:hypothetical protein PGTUg99_021516 [Puccinia graminis f. sp. tritici]